MLILHTAQLRVKNFDKLIILWNIWSVAFVTKSWHKLKKLLDEIKDLKMYLDVVLCLDLYLKFVIH